MKVLKAIWDLFVYVVVYAFYCAGCIGLALTVDKVTGGRLLDFDPER